jgi:hypothetical protein
VNDLAERALRELERARRQVVRHPILSLAAGGFVASAVIVGAGGRILLGGTTTPLSGWLGLSTKHAAARPALVAATCFIGICLLVLLWFVLLTVMRRRERAAEGTNALTSPAPLSVRTIWQIAGVWALPFVIGPPLLTTDVFGYVARGMLQRDGLNPYRHAALALGNLPIVAAIDVTWRGTESTAGPLATWLQHATVTVTGGHALAAVLVYRAIAVLSVIAIGILATRLAGGPNASMALALTVLNPAVLLYVVSAAHLEGLLAALLLGALVAARRDRWLLAVALVSIAAGFAPILLVALPAVLIAHAAVGGPRVPWGRLSLEAGCAIVLLAVSSLVVQDGLGWRHNFDEITRERTPFAPASLLADLINPIVTPASADDLVAGARIAVGLAAAAIVLYLLITTPRRPLERTIGYCLLSVGLLAPVLYPWYLLWGLLVLAPTATGARRDWVVALSAAACVLAPVGFGPEVAQTLTRVALAAIAIVLMVSLNRRRAGTHTWIVRTR